MDHYKPSQSKEVQIAKKALSEEILELKNAESESAIKKTKTAHGSSIPLTPEYFAKERNIALNNQLNVYEVLGLKNQGQVMVDELECSLLSDVTLQSLPMLLHQFYVDQMKRYVQCYHAQMLRWKRYGEHADTLAWIYAKYKLRLVLIKKRYEDAKQRAQRLAAWQISYIIQDKSTKTCLVPDDVTIFLRWLIYHLRCTKKLFCFLKILKWLPVTNRQNIQIESLTALQSSGVAGDQSGKNDAKSAWKSMTAGLDFSFLSPTPSSHKTSTATSESTVMISDPSFAGFVSNEATLGIPCHMTDLSSFRAHLESLVTEYGITMRNELLTSGDEMELFGAVNRHFKNLFNRQLECAKFYQYDNVPEGYNHWGIDSATHCLKKPSNWLNDIRVKPRKKANQLLQLTCLKEEGNVDELMTAHNKFLEVSDFARVTEALKKHAIAVREPPIVQSLLVTSYPKGKLKSQSVWNSVYKNSEQKNTSNSKNMAPGETRFLKHLKRDSYDYNNTLQMLGLEDGDDARNQDPTNIQGGYLSYLHLRHLKIRDLKRQCLALLNYFRSIERMMTIYDGGLSLEDTSLKLDEKIDKIIADDIKKKRIRAYSLGLGTSDSDFASKRSQDRGLSSHQYMHDKPDHFKIDEEAFMKYNDIENHDDFYSLGKSQDDVITAGWKNPITSGMTPDPNAAKSIPYVQDHRGYFIIYDAALADLENLSDELMLLASHYIEKDTANREVSRSAAEKIQMAKSFDEEVDLACYAHREVDRFAVLLDLWTCEQNFLINKRKFLDCFVEAYHHCFDPEERSNLTQILTDVIHQRPRYDLADHYFVRSYREECLCISLKTNLTSKILSSHMEDCKCYLRRRARSPSALGMPMFSPAKQEISINLPKPSLKYVDMFEFHPSAGLLACRLYEAFGIAMHKMQQINRPSTMNELMSLERQILEHSRHEWEVMSAIGSSFSDQVQGDILSVDFIEDVYEVDDAIQNYIKETIPGDANSDEKKNSSIKVWSHAVDAILLRHRLVDAAWETELVSKLYKKAASQLEYGEAHLHSRPLHFTNESPRKNVATNLSTLSGYVVHDVMADKYLPNRLNLAIEELDSKHLTQFSFQNPSDFLQIVNDKGKLHTVQVALACQASHKNALIIAVTQAENCALWKEVKTTSYPDNERVHRDGLDSQVRLSAQSSCATQRSLNCTSSQTASPKKTKSPLGIFNATAAKYMTEKPKKYPEAFISIQLEKCGLRNVVNNAFITEMKNNSILMTKPAEVEELKRKLATDFCRELLFRMSLHAMRAQIIACYSAILDALSCYPSMRDRFFIVGLPNEEKRKKDDVAGMVLDPKVFQKRPRRVLSSLGKAFLNLWFIPHFTEILTAYRGLDYELQENILTTWLLIATSLHDIVFYLFARARLDSVAKSKCRSLYEAANDIHWKEAEMIGVQLNELQGQINSLDSEPYPSTKSPRKVAELLSMKKEIFFYEFDVAIQYALRDSFLTQNNYEAYQCVTDQMDVALPRLSNMLRSSITALQLSLPKLLATDMKEAMKFMPWLRFQHSNGSHPTACPLYWGDTESCMLLCIAGLKRKDKQLANSTIQETHNLLNKVLEDGTITYEGLEEIPEELPKGFIMSIPVGKIQSIAYGQSLNESVKQLNLKTDLRGSDVNVPNAARKELRKKKYPKYDPRLPLDKLLFPIDAFRIWKQLENFKLDWAQVKLNCHRLDEPRLYREMECLFRAEIVLPVYSDMACRIGFPDMYHEMEGSDCPLTPPPGAPILVTKARLLKKLIDLHELRAISNARELMRNKYRSLLLAERTARNSSDSNFLAETPKPSADRLITNESSVLVEDFIKTLMSQSASTNDRISFDKTHLSNCVSKLSGDMTRRERDDYLSFSSRFDYLLRHYTGLMESNKVHTSASGAKCYSSFGTKTGRNTEYQLADRSHELIMEVTALRAKLVEMQVQVEKTKEEMERKARGDCEDVVHYLFDACFEMKSRLAQRHLAIIDEVHQLIGKTRAEALKKTARAKHIWPTSTADERQKLINTKERRATKLINRTSRLDGIARKMQVFRCWQLFTAGRRQTEKLEELQLAFTRLRRYALSKNMLLKEESNYYYEELLKVRKCLQTIDEELLITFEEKERRRKMRTAREYTESMAQTKRRAYAQANEYNRSRLEEEIEEKTKRIETVSSEIKKHAVFEEKKQLKLKSAVRELSVEVSSEQSLKHDAVQVAERLEAQKNGLLQPPGTPDLLLTSRPSTATWPTASHEKLSNYTRNRTRSAETPFTFSVASKKRARSYNCLPRVLTRDPATPLPKGRPNTSAERFKVRLAYTLRNGEYPTEPSEDDSF